MEVEFLCQEVLTGRILGNVELEGFSLTSTLNDFGEWRASVKNRQVGGVYPTHLVEPWKCRIFLLVDGVPVEALDIWSRIRRLGSDTFEIAGRTAGSVLERWTIGGRDGREYRFFNVEQRQIAKQLVDGAFQEWGPAGIAVPTPDLVNARYRDKTTWEAEDAKPVAEALRDLANLRNGFQFRFEPFVLNGAYGVQMITGAPYLNRRPPVFLESARDPHGGMRGNIVTLEVEESVETYATDVTVWGSGEGRSKLRGYASNDALAKGIPRIGRTENRSDVVTQQWLNDRASTVRDASGSLYYPPVASIRMDDVAHPFGSYQVGDEVYVHVDPGADFPEGFYGKWRLIEVAFDWGVSESMVTLTIGDPDA